MEEEWGLGSKGFLTGGGLNAEHKLETEEGWNSR